MPNDALAKIRLEAKRIQKRHPGKKYQTALKEAGKAYRAGTISGLGKRKRKTAKKSHGGHTTGSHHRIHRVAGVDRLSISQSEAITRRKIKEELGWLLASQRTAATKGEKKRLQPKINELTKKLKALG